MIGIGYMEIIVALVIMLVILGPERMPVVVKSIARFVREIRSVASEARAQLNEVVDVHELQQMAEDAKRKVTEAKQAADVNGVVRDALTKDAPPAQPADAETSMSSEPPEETQE